MTPFQIIHAERIRSDVAILVAQIAGFSSAEYETLVGELNALALPYYRDCRTRDMSLATIRECFAEELRYLAGRLHPG